MRSPGRPSLARRDPQTPLALATALAACALLALAPATAHAGRPLPDFRTISTPHFRLNYPVGLEAVAFRAARILEEANAYLVPLMHHQPTEKTEVSLTDFGDSANGAATALPSNRISLLAAPPGLDGNLGDYDDWLRVLIYHEYTHILHLDTVRGVPAWLNHIFGKKLAPNQNMPSFLVEGVAVHMESLSSGRGRIRSAQFRGWLRTAALDGSLHDLDEVTHYPQTFPGANVWYMYGGHFMDWVARTRGGDTLARMFEAYGHDVIPFAPNRAAMEGVGETVTELWAAWQADLRASAEAFRTQRAADPTFGGLVEPTPLTTTGLRHENPRFLPDGSLLALEGDPRSETALWRRPSGGTGPRERYLRLESTERFDVCPANGHVMLEQTDPLEGAWSSTDLWTWDGHRKSRVTRGARVREPACAPDGTWVAAAQLVDGRTRIVRIALADGAVTTLYDPGGVDQVGYPAVSPDGRAVVFVVAAHGRRDLVRFNLADGAVEPLTDDDALELHPRFTADGRQLVYTSDRTGVFELYTLPLDASGRPSGPAVRHTNSVGGVLEAEPAPTGGYATTILTSKGDDLGVLAASPVGPSATVPEAADLPTGPPPRPDVGERPLPSAPYDPTDSLWPTVWAPQIALSSPEDNTQRLGVLVDAGDALGYHQLVGQFTTAPEAGGYATALSYGYHRHVPNFSLSATHETRVRDGGQYYADARHPVREDVSSASGAVGLSLSRGGHSGSISARYAMAWFRPDANPIPSFDPLDQIPALPSASRSTDLTVGFHYRDSERYPESIADETGTALSVTFRFRNDLLGSRTDTSEAFFDAEKYVGLWWRHVLALRVSAGFGIGPGGSNLYYALSPSPERDVLLDALDGIYFGSNFLRGFPAGTVAGGRYVLGTAEYRLPLFDLFRGFSMVPFFFENLQFSVFTDWAQGADGPFQGKTSAFSKSIGAELSLHGLLGWRLPVDARTGWAKGLGKAGENQVYLFVGNWF